MAETIDETAPTETDPAVTQAPEPEEKKKKKKRGGFWRVVFWLALIVFVGSLGALGYLAYTYWAGQAEYDDIAEKSLKKGTTLADFVVDWDALREINPDIVGWVYVPDTVISYPIAHKAGDNEYYLHHNFSLGEGRFGAEFGSIMLAGDNAPDFSDQVNIIYGHHMRNGSMFAKVAEFHESKVFNEHRDIYLLTPEGNYRLYTFACDHVPMSDGSIATPNYNTDEEWNDFKASLVLDSVVTPKPDDTDLADVTKVFGFCTCDGADNTWRYITFAEVAEFIPIEKVGKGPAGSKVDKSDVKDVKKDSKERTK